MGAAIFRARGKHEDGDARPSTRELVADAAFCELLAEDLGVKVSTARTAFIHEPVARALKVREWAFEKAPHSAEKRAKLILGWAKRRKAGAFRDQDAEAEKEIARRIACYWQQNPERLAETLRAAMFVLKTLGKKRGWVERQELSGAQGQAQEVVITWGEETGVWAKP